MKWHYDRGETQWRDVDGAVLWRIHLHAIHSAEQARRVIGHARAALGDEAAEGLRELVKRHRRKEASRQ